MIARKASSACRRLPRPLLSRSCSNQFRNHRRRPDSTRSEDPTRHTPRPRAPPAGRRKGSGPVRARSGATGRCAVGTRGVGAASRRGAARGKRHCPRLSRPPAAAPRRMGVGASVVARWHRDAGPPPRASQAPPAVPSPVGQGVAPSRRMACKCDEPTPVTNAACVAAPHDRSLPWDDNAVGARMNGVGTCPR